jgi:polyribonucleotide nucleotidyltransferase
MLNVKRWSTNWGGRNMIIETGKYALQATSSLTVQYGDTVVLATVVMSEKPKTGVDFFPLSVEFQEKLSAAGKIKGSRFIKREGRPSDESILWGRVVDRAIRPLFDNSMRHEVQLVLTPLSYDTDANLTLVSLVAASAVLSISPIPWNGPMGASLIGRVAGELILNPTEAQMKESDLDMMLAGTPEKLVMIESNSKELPEDQTLAAMEFGLNHTKDLITFIESIRTEMAVEKYAAAETDEKKEVARVTELTLNYMRSQADTVIFDSIKIGRKDRVGMVKKLKEGVVAYLTEQGVDEKLIEQMGVAAKEMVGIVISERILSKEQRLDGRNLTEIRELHAEVDLLPRVHGSGMFMRGDTQVLSTVTLGAPGDAQTVDTMDEEFKKRYMHHYADAPYTYGEAGPMRGPGRRAIGHGALAERALEPVLPAEVDFPYAIRVMSEVLGSNGSSSMASTCGSSLSLMAAGVPITRPVAGIAMGLATDTKSGAWKVLTDLQDVEDGPGGMDFKIAGTDVGITAIQMDTKTQGLGWDIIRQTFAQARDARLVILKKMAEAIAEPRKELSPYAPRITTLQINPEKIGDLIGPGGKTIKKIIEETGVDIDIEQDGRVLITSSDATAMAAAIERVNLITKDVLAGETYEGAVVRIESFGAFVNILPGKDGLVHVSEISWSRVNAPGDVLKLGDKVKVIVKEIDAMGRVNLSIRALLPKPEGYVERPPMDRPPRTGGFSGGGNRGGHSGGGNRGGGFDRGPRPPQQFNRPTPPPVPSAPTAAPSAPSFPPTASAVPPKEEKRGFFGFGKKSE